MDPSVLTIGEIRKGLGQINNDQYREKVRLWLDQDLIAWFENRILPIAQYVANKWALLQAQTNRALPAIDSLIAATALHFDLIIVTRNVKDYDINMLEVINPFL